VVILPEKDKYYAANKQVAEIEDNYKMGLISNEEKNV
jgi:hypothetical protein